MTQALPGQAVAELLTWFAEQQRALPWRSAPIGQRPPYGVWVSEIMAQQTRLEVVVPYYERWMAAFPAVEDLAAAPEDEVLRLWAGLGYYRRARLLQAAAQELVEAGARGVGGDRWPESAEGWQALPGVGEYTAAAVASFSADEAAPVVDGNVKRVAARALALELARDDRALHRAAEDWMRAGMAALPSGTPPGTWNEAVMELGATLCTPQKPQCERCPLQAGCALRQEAGEEAPSRAVGIPLRSKRKQWKDLELVIGLATAPRGGGVLLVQRAEGWNPGLWEPPSLVLASADLPVSQEAPESASTDALREAWLAAGCPGELGDELGTVKHTITRHRITARVHHLNPPADAAYQDDSLVGLTGLARKILARWL